MKKGLKNFYLKNKTSLYFILIFLILVILGLLLYYPVIKYNYLVPPGDDAFVHLTNLKYYQIEGFKVGTGYPIGFYWLIDTIGNILNLDNVQTMVYVFPFLLVLSAFVIWLLVYLFFGQVSALIVLILYAFFARQPIQTLYDGGFPNVLAGSILLPLLMIFLIKIFTSKIKNQKIIFSILYLLTFCAIILTHHLTTLFAFGINIVLIPILTYIYYLREKKKKKFNALLIALLSFVIIIAFLVILKGLNILSSSEALADQFLIINSTYPFIHFIGHLNDPNAIYHNLREYGGGLSRIIVVLGILGLYNVFINLKNKQNIYFYTAISTWALVIFVISRISQIGFPVRAGRDLIYPLTILAGTGLAQVWHEKNKKIKTLIYLVILIIFIKWGYGDLKVKIDAMTSQSSMIRYAQIDQEINNEVPQDAKLAVYAMDQFYPFFRNPELTINFTPTLEPQYINYKDFDYLIVEVLNDNVYAWGKTDNTFFSIKPDIQLLSERQDKFKKVYLYKIIK